MKYEIDSKGSTETSTITKTGSNYRRSTESLTIIKTESGSKGSTETSTINRTGSKFRGYKEPFNLKVTLDAPWNPP
jgi:hypothetical protein